MLSCEDQTPLSPKVLHCLHRRRNCSWLLHFLTSRPLPQDDSSEVLEIGGRREDSHSILFPAENRPLKPLPLDSHHCQSGPSHSKEARCSIGDLVDAQSLGGKGWTTTSLNRSSPSSSRDYWIEPQDQRPFSPFPL